VISHLLIAMACMAPAPGGGKGEVEGAWVTMPSGDVFEPLLADPKQPHSHAAALAAHSKASSDLVGAVGYGDTVGFVRWPGPGEGGWQLGMSGAVFAQFDLRAYSTRLLNADYTIGVALSRRRHAWSGRMRVYHQSSHLGDDILIVRKVERVKLDYEAVELIAAAERRAFRLYGGGEILIRRLPLALPVAIWHVGLEYRHPKRFAVGARVQGQLVAGVDAKRSWSSSRIADVSARGGVEFGPPVVDDRWRRRWAVLAQWDEGGSYGQFFAERASSLGIGAHLIL
jgi:hypothetical protein